MTHATIAGTPLTDLFSGRENPWAKVYDPARIRYQHGASLMEFLKENVNVAAQYRDYLTPARCARAGSYDEVRHG